MPKVICQKHDPKVWMKLQMKIGPEMCLWQINSNGSNLSLHSPEHFTIFQMERNWLEKRHTVAEGFKHRIPHQYRLYSLLLLSKLLFLHWNVNCFHHNVTTCQFLQTALCIKYFYLQGQHTVDCLKELDKCSMSSSMGLKSGFKLKCKSFSHRHRGRRWLHLNPG